jgi:hypothetical protein
MQLNEQGHREAKISLKASGVGEEQEQALNSGQGDERLIEGVGEVRVLGHEDNGMSDVSTCGRDGGAHNYKFADGFRVIKEQFVNIL